MGQRRTIAVVTGSRAEFGLLEPVMRAIHEGPVGCDQHDAGRVWSPGRAMVTKPRSGRHGRDARTAGVAGPVKLRLYTLVTGSHLTTGTIADVGEAGFKVDTRVPMYQQKIEGRRADVTALARGISGVGKVLADVKPDVVLVLGDRVEALAAACAASVGGFCLGHIHGGDRAEGVADEAMRHAISKMAHLHFTATAQSRRRLIRMGEDPDRVFRVGSPAIDGLKHVKPADDGPALVLIQHPIGASDDQEHRWMQQTLCATSGYHRLVLAPNRDPGCRGIRRALRSGRIDVIEHLPRARFLSLLAGAQAIVGNSSAGLIEAAALGRACVNIGPRQAGREQPVGVVDCNYGTRAVAAALKKALRSPRGRRPRHPYGHGHAGRRIAQLLAAIDLTTISVRKRNTY